MLGFHVLRAAAACPGLCSSKDVLITGHWVLSEPTYNNVTVDTWLNLECVS